MKLTNGNLSSRMVAPAAAPGAGSTIGGAAASNQAWGQSDTSHAASVQGTGDLFGMHNTPLHVGGIVLFAGLGLLAFRVAGFRFAFDAGFGK